MPLMTISFVVTYIYMWYYITCITSVYDVSYFFMLNMIRLLFRIVCYGQTYCELFIEGYYCFGLFQNHTSPLTTQTRHFWRCTLYRSTDQCPVKRHTSKKKKNKCQMQRNHWSDGWALEITKYGEMEPATLNWWHVRMHQEQTGNPKNMSYGAQWVCGGMRFLP